MKTRLTLFLTATALSPLAATPALAESSGEAGEFESSGLATNGAAAISSIRTPEERKLNPELKVANVSTAKNSNRFSSIATIGDGAAPPVSATGYSLAGADSGFAGNIDAGYVGTPIAPSDASALTGASAAAAAAAQGSPAAREDSYSVLLNQDSFFGFYPSFNGLIPIGDNVDFSFYGILWTNSGFSTVVGTDGDLWTEFGVGANFHLADGKLQVKPQIGLTNGALLSGGVVDANGDPTSTGGNFADGIVPSLTVNYGDDSFEAEFYGGYYAALRNRNDNAALDFLHTWINAGYRFSDKFSAGGHYELLSNTRNTFPGGSSAVVYQWLGPYVQFSLDNGFFARFTAGADIEDGNDGDFYKLTAGFSF
ncbi:MAG: DUF6733 family protein [Pseudomonadota bacterium]